MDNPRLDSPGAAPRPRGRAAPARGPGLSEPLLDARVPRRAGHGTLALVIGLLAGCANIPPPPASQAPGGAAPRADGPRPRAGYESRVDPLSEIDTTALAGRRIVLDPGHGGFFRGAMGVNGLTEAEVNLGVALHLRGLLEARGATVFMTRTDDRDFLTPADSTLRFDLAERTRIANAFQPELFISIHHNADAGGKHDVNEIQTYYKLGDEGPSLDIARSVHRYLVRNLAIEKHRILPGNYFVLRNSTAPALLTEASYITNPDVEAKLVLAAKQRLEAEALLLGIAKYFARRVPEVEEFRAWSPRGGTPDTVFSDIEAPLLQARIAGAFDQYELRLDGAPLEGTRTGQTIEWRPPPLAAGRHEAVLRVRLAGEGAAPEERLAFRMAREPLEIEIEHGAPAVGPEGGLMALRIRVLDETRQPWRDSAWVRVADDGGRATLSPRDTVVVARDGVAWAYFRVGPRAPSAIRARGTPAQIPSSYVRAWLVPRDRPAADAREGTTRSSLSRISQSRDPNLWVGFVRSMPADTMLANAPGTREPNPTVRWLNRDGFAVLERSAARGGIVPALPGYRRWGADTLPPRLTAIAGGALHGRRIVIDPDGGGENPAGTGRSGTRAAGLNLEVARALAGLLEAAGAQVKLTREGDFALSEVERVQISEAFRADRFLRIGHRAEPPRLGHYYSSANGKRWAEATARELARLGLPAPPVAEDAQYPLQQTSCPALYVAPARVDDAAAEERLLAPGALRAEAYGLFLGLAREWLPAAEWPLDSLEVRDPSGRPASGAAIGFGGGIVLETDARGRLRFARTERGPVELEVDHPRIRHRTLLLDSSRGTILTGLDTP